MYSYIPETNRVLRYIELHLFCIFYLC
jgi:hypothetical protein